MTNTVLASQEVIPHPAAPQTLEESGLSLDLILQLVLKTLHFGGELSGSDLARRIGRRADSSGHAAIALRLPMSRREIGQYLGYAEETVCRSLRRLQRRGPVQVRGRELQLPSEEVAELAAG